MLKPRDSGIVHPVTINGVRVEQQGDVLTVRGEEWLTLVPEDDNDERVWEYSLTTGRIMQTRFA